MASILVFIFLPALSHQPQDTMYYVEHDFLKNIIHISDELLTYIICLCKHT